MGSRRKGRDYVTLALEFVFISGLLAVAVLASPFILWKWWTMPKEVDGTGWFMPEPNPPKSSGRGRPA